MKTNKESYYQIGLTKSGLTRKEYEQKRNDFFIARWKLSINKPKRIREFIAKEHKGRAVILYHNEMFRCEDVVCGSLGRINKGKVFQVPHHKDGDTLVFKIK